MSLHSLPTEILTGVLRLVTPNELVRLAGTCKRFRDLVEPLLWTDLEFHEAGYHGSKAELQAPPPFVSPSQRRCPESSGRWGRGRGCEMKAEHFFNLLQYYQVKDENRLRQLASRVRSLCTVVKPGWRPGKYFDRAQAEKCPQVWTLLPYFVNLEVLELHGDSNHSSWAKEEEPYTLDPVCNLRFVKLFAYIPRPVASWAILSGSKLERLELGMLDRPISSNLENNPRYRPLPSDKIGDGSGGGESEDDSGDDGSDYGSLDGEIVIPRPLGGVLSDYNGPEISLPRLRHLYLCQPCDGQYTESVQEYNWSSRAAQGTLMDWVKILMAARDTMETLVLEQRVAADYLENDGLTEEEFIAENVYSNASEDLLRAVQDILEEKKFLVLNRVYLYGIAVGDTGAGEPAAHVPGGRFMLALKDRDIRCEARFGTWCFFDKDPGVTYWASWYYEQEEEGEDSGAEFHRDSVLASVQPAEFIE